MPETSSRAGLRSANVSGAAETTARASSEAGASRPERHFSQFVRFCVVGLIQNGLNVGTYAILIALGVPYLPAVVPAALVALAASFALNRRWTFPGRTDRTRRRAARFVAIWVTILLLGLPLLSLLVEVAGLPRVLSQAIVILVGAPISYLAQRRFTFAHD